MAPRCDFDSDSTTVVLVPTATSRSVTSFSFLETDTCKCRFIFRGDEHNMIFVVSARMIDIRRVLVEIHENVFNEF